LPHRRAALPDQPMNQREYFDADYFERGWTKGTAYTRYSTAGGSPLFRELASGIIDVFRPKRVLEVGCATGFIVSQLNSLGCEAWGLDVSEWAVRNAAHSRVILASADAIPFPDGYFDLVVSCHAIEHLPSSIFDRAISEMIRVCSGFQFHMLPIVGEGPYTGPVEQVIGNLQKDPTHQQLHDRAWWISAFERAGACELPIAVPFYLDTSQSELSSCQFSISVGREQENSLVMLRAAERNRRSYRRLRIAATTGLQNNDLKPLQFDSMRQWKDIEVVLGSAFLDISSALLRLVVLSDGSDETLLRLAVGQDEDGVAFIHAAEYYASVKPGLNLFVFSSAEMAVLRGTPDYSRIEHVVFGGEAADLRISAGLYDESGRSIFATSRTQV
jgi:SAM-dependent methyltransferase